MDEVDSQYLRPITSYQEGVIDADEAAEQLVALVREDNGLHNLVMITPLIAEEMVRQLDTGALADGELQFPLAEALYWHCVDNHEGQSSERYRILSTLGYRPGASETSPINDQHRPDAGHVYQLLND